MILQMINLDAFDCSAEKLFQFFRDSMSRRQISINNIVGLFCDNTNAMVGQFNSFYTRLKATSLNLILCQFVRHYLALTF